MSHLIHNRGELLETLVSAFDTTEPIEDRGWGKMLSYCPAESPEFDYIASLEDGYDSSRAAEENEAIAFDLLEIQDQIKKETNDIALFCRSKPEVVQTAYRRARGLQTIASLQEHFAERDEDSPVRQYLDALQAEYHNRPEADMGLLLEQWIDWIGLETSAKQRLQGADIYRVWQGVGLTLEELRAQPNVGSSYAAKFQEAINNLGLNMGMDVSPYVDQNQ